MAARPATPSTRSSSARRTWKSPRSTRATRTRSTKLTDKVKKGGVGVWGQIPMPPNAQVPEADIKELVTWILTLKK